ncbi:MAG: class I SAM-dependent methyltransferase [Actinomycetota bacterium]|nr:class I SAM-dependent methyltransferase [Actinomycetota bacterium]
MVNESSTASKIREELIALDLIIESRLELFCQGTRDKSDIPVFQDVSSAVIFHDFYPGDEFYATTNGGFDSLGRTVDPKMGVTNAGMRFEQRKDLERRIESNLQLIAHRHVVDFGCGEGWFLRSAKNLAKSVCGIELNNYCKETLNKGGIDCVADFSPGRKVDTLTMFHTLEHTPSQLVTLEKAHELLSRSSTRSDVSGAVIIEVPHARDFLLSTLNHEGFRKFTLRSDHCILHTRESLTRFMEYVGFKRVSIRSVQRYPLSNHLGWLSRNSPGGHTSDLSVLDSGTLHAAYESALAQVDATDTIVAIGFVDKS